MKLIDIIKEEVLRSIPISLRRRMDIQSMDNSFYNSLDETSDDFINPDKLLYNCNLFVFKKFVIDDMLVNISEEMEGGRQSIFGDYDEEGDNDDLYHDMIRKPLMDYYRTKLDKRYIELREHLKYITS
tara:strand:- start:23 stop:406 length:384 start_codon:yes stop_codon:yes gene_type:complete